MSAQPPRIGLVTVSLPSERVELCEPFADGVERGLRESGFEVLATAAPAMSHEDVAAAVADVTERGAASIVYGIATWVDPPAVVRPAQASRLPSVIVANPAPASFGFTGASLIHGALDRLSAPHRIHLGTPGDELWNTAVVAYGRAAAVAQEFRDLRYGLFGGQSPGQYTGQVDMLEARLRFGLEIEQVDELVVIDRARAIPDERAHAVIAELRDGYGGLDADGGALLRAAKLRLALEEQVDERGFAFASVKCLSEAINSYASFCVAAGILNDAGRTISCQGDVPATILMEALRLLSGGATFFGDLVTLDPENGRGRIVNCGAGPVSLAASPQAVEWNRQYDYMGAGGGVTSTFMTRPGAVTVAAMTQVADGFRMMIARGEAYERPREELAEVRANWPHAFVQFDGDARAIVHELRSNHVVMAYGDHADELMALAELWDLEGTLI